MTEYRIEFQIQRRRDGEEDFTEVGFGTSGVWDSVNAASFSMESAIQNREWETEVGQPDPDDLER